MTAEDFKIWLDGYLSGVEADRKGLTKTQVSKIRDKMNEINTFIFYPSTSQTIIPTSWEPDEPIVYHDDSVTIIETLVD